jgi:hypothetical protein
VPTVFELIDLLSRGNQPAALSGTFRWLDSEERQRTWKVWRRGRLARIEEPPGVMALIATEQTYWMNWPPAEGVVAVPRNPEIDDFELSALTRPAGDEPPEDVLSRDPHLLVPVTDAASPPLDVHTYRVRFQRWEEGTGPRLTGIQEFVQVLETLDAPARAATVSGERTTYTFLLDAPATRVLACVAVDPPSTA